MALPSFPTAPGPEFSEFMRKSEQLKGVRLQEAVPSEYLKPNVARGLLGFALSWLLYGGAVAGVAFAPAYLWPVLWVVAGLGGWGLHCIAHDCGHGSFSRSRRLNSVIGHTALLPLVYPFHAWRHVHNLHHAHTNNLELDTDWRPLPGRMYEGMPLRQKIVYKGTRTFAFWFGTVNYWRVSGFRPGFFPKRAMRRDVARSIVVVAVVCALYLPALGYFFGVQGLLTMFLAPWLFIHAWFSATTLMHHSTSDVPYLSGEHWTRNAGRLLVTTDYTYPRWLLFLTHNISIHTAHHVIPAVPFYHLPKAQEALKEAFPDMVRERRFTFGELWRILRDCHFYDTESGFYTDFGHHPVPARDHSKAPAA
ncbi:MULTISPECIES: fatty acid desaturase [unclassified Streptomyces]|uniref:fatty acid desaturase n=1 Tax=unclassified Streptomyces TaxID=2593676 RepID=UPI00331D7FF8